MVSQLSSKVLRIGIITGLFASTVWLGLGMPTGGARAATFQPDWVSDSPDPYPLAGYGYSLAALGDEVIVGQPGGGTSEPGTAYVLDASTGQLLHTLQNPTPAADDRFGADVAIGNSKFAVGAPRDDAVATDAGAVHVFNGSGALLGTIVDPNGGAGDHFGASVTFAPSDFYAIGAPGYDNSSGKVYVYDPQSSGFSVTISNPTPGLDDHFGAEVAAIPETYSFAVGAPGHNGGEGAAYVFDSTSGALEQTFHSPNAVPDGHFGAALAMNQDGLVVVGEPQGDVGGIPAGAAYVFDVSTGGLLATFENPQPAAGDRFGAAVSVFPGDFSTMGAFPGDFIIGAPADDTAGTNAGTAYIGDVDGSYVPITFNFTPAVGDEFGSALATTWNPFVADPDVWLISGSPGADTLSGDIDVGLVQGFCLDWDEDGICDGDDPEDDGDQCPDVNEQQTAPGSELSGGRRGYRNHWDYFNPTHDGKNRVDDVIKVVLQYGKDDTDANPGLPPYTLGYNPDTDRTYIGPNVWNLGPPDGQQRIIDILAQVYQYNHDCP